MTDVVSPATRFRPITGLIGAPVETLLISDADWCHVPPAVPSRTWYGLLSTLRLVHVVRPSGDCVSCVPSEPLTSEAVIAQPNNGTSSPSHSPFAFLS